MSEGAGDSQVSTGASGSDHKEQAGEAAPVLASAVTAVGLTPVQTVGSAPTPPEGGRSAETLGPPLASTPQATSASRELAADRVFAAATGIVTGGVAGWPAAPGASAPGAAIALARVAGGSLTPTIDSALPAGDRDGGAEIENHPSAPIPGSGGAGVGSAAGGGSGGACSASSILVGDLFHVAPVVMRRLCLAQPSWRTASFELILERPD